MAQLFGRCIYRGPESGVDDGVAESIVHLSRQRMPEADRFERLWGRPDERGPRRDRLAGLAWAGRRDLLERHGFYDACVLGAGDRAFACAAFGQHRKTAQAWLRTPQQEQHYFAWADAFAADLDGRIGMQLLIETAEGILNLRELAQADPIVEILGLGEGDLCAELACEKPYLWPPRWEAVLVSRAAGLRRPIQGGHPGLSDSEHFEMTTIEGKQAGFFGRVALHPSQVETINRVYTRCIHEVEYARDALERLGEVIGKGQRTTRDMHGRYLSEWYRASAERILEEFDRFGALASCPGCSAARSDESGVSYPR